MLTRRLTRRSALRGVLGAATVSVGIPLLDCFLDTNGVALAEIYAAVFKRLLPGPNWLKGVLFAETFITGAWSLTPLADKYHPLIQDGELPRLATPVAFLQNLVRHLVFGLALGVLYRDNREQ